MNIVNLYLCQLFLILTEYQVEIDENQHTNYSCENKRTMEIFNDLGRRPLVMIRFTVATIKAWDIPHRSHC